MKRKILQICVFSLLMKLLKMSTQQEKFSIQDTFNLSSDADSSTDKHIHGHCNSMTESAQRADQ